MVMTLSLLLGFILVTSGCLGIVSNDGPPDKFNVTFEEPTTGEVFTNMSYYGHTHSELSYEVNASTAVDRTDEIRVYRQNNDSWELFYRINITSDFVHFDIHAPPSRFASPKHHQIRAWNETYGVIDILNATSRYEG
ncbi:hypothetical protein [Halorhabdus sp. CUG00001]|uniref:hypothetical protein n=1 Tax=Halorhabdus sp. CUG00001 TaxID=2600297 RepID=UPI00131C080F|nr:hypothetical protein [Halorhabdus sp. CUG00001]